MSLIQSVCYSVSFRAVKYKCSKQAYEQDYSMSNKSYLSLEEDVLALPILHHAHVLKRAHDVVGIHSHLLTHVCTRNTMLSELTAALHTVTYHRYST